MGCPTQSIPVLELLGQHKCRDLCLYKAIKYIQKHIYKGLDPATAQVDDPNHNEIKQYLQGRYSGTTKTVWRLFEFGTNEEWSPVIQLSPHQVNSRFISKQMLALWQWGKGWRTGFNLYSATDEKLIDHMQLRDYIAAITILGGVCFPVTPTQYLLADVTSLS